MMCIYIDERWTVVKYKPTSQVPRPRSGVSMALHTTGATFTTLLQFPSLHALYLHYIYTSHSSYITPLTSYCICYTLPMLLILYHSFYYTYMYTRGRAVHIRRIQQGEGVRAEERRPHTRGYVGD